MNNKISNFLTFVIDFCCKIAQYLDLNGNLINSSKIFNMCYENIVLEVISTSTSVIIIILYIEYIIIKKMWTIFITICNKINKIRIIKTCTLINKKWS
jgi:hypothetical protein